MVINLLREASKGFWGKSTEVRVPPCTLQNNSVEVLHLSDCTEERKLLRKNLPHYWQWSLGNLEYIAFLQLGFLTNALPQILFLGDSALISTAGRALLK